jgi:hypothetical protein
LNNGHIYYIPFSSNGSDSWEGKYSGAYSFKNNDSKIYWTPNFSSNSLILNVLFLVPSILELNNNEINEMIS